MSKILDAANLLGTYMELGKQITAGKMTENAEEAQARKDSMNACREIIGGQYSFSETQEAIKEGREEFKKEFPNSYR